MDVLLTIFWCIVVLGFLVVIHEGGHYLSARAFGVRVSEFMVGLPGPNVGIVRNGTKFGVTAVPLGGYARVCGMEPGPESPHLRAAMECVFRCGTVVAEDFAAECGISTDAALEALDELVEWGTIEPPRRKDKVNVYRTLPVYAKGGKRACEAGEPRPLDDVEAFYRAERAQQYRSLPFWKRSVILCAGPGVNILFAILAFIAIFSVVGVDVQTQAGEVVHRTIAPWYSVQIGFAYIASVFQAILGLFNPQTAAETVSGSTSIVGIAVLSKSAADAGAESFVMFTAMLSVSLGLMNMLPIPPLDGGRFVVEIIQKLRRRDITLRTLNWASGIGFFLFMAFFVFMLNQDVQRFIL